ncbi:MAG: hypothetical protein WBX22_07425 [Silvibacterium sp.]|jgi:hypothetical protein
MSQYPSPPPTVIVASTKSVALSLVFTFFFGPLGMLYSTIWGALVMIVLSVPAFFLTLGHGAFLIWPISMIWGAWAAHRYNQRLLRRAGL